MYFLVKEKRIHSLRYLHFCWYELSTLHGPIFFRSKVEWLKFYNMLVPKFRLVGFNPFEKYVRQIGSSPRDTNKKMFQTTTEEKMFSQGLISRILISNIQGVSIVHHHQFHHKNSGSPRGLRMIMWIKKHTQMLQTTKRLHTLKTEIIIVPFTKGWLENDWFHFPFKMVLCQRTFVTCWEGISQDNRTITLSLRLAGILRRLLVSGPTSCDQKITENTSLEIPNLTIKALWIWHWSCIACKQIPARFRFQDRWYKWLPPSCFIDLFLKKLSNHRAIGQECLELWGLTCGGWGGCFLLGTDGILSLMGIP